MWSYAIDDGARLLLFDPLAVPGQTLELAADREPVVVLTAPWHERETRSLVERLRALVFVPPPDTQDDLVRKFGVTLEQAAGGSPDVAWLLAGDSGEAHLYLAGEGASRASRSPRTAAAARTAGRGRAPGARSTDRPCCSRTRALLTADVHPVAWVRVLSLRDSNLNGFVRKESAQVARIREILAGADASDRDHGRGATGEPESTPR